MKPHSLYFIFMLLCVPLLGQAQSGRGYYKDVFMDGGVELIPRTDLPAARYLNLSMEKFVATQYGEKDSLTSRDTLIQNAMFCGNAMDENGILLYPDGSPRFRVLFVNGGLAAYHGRSLTTRGRENIRRFIRAGGSYLGCCAGAFLGSIAPVVDEQNLKPYASYLAIWPGYTAETKLFDAYTGVFLEKNSPLLRYYDFGGDLYIDSLRHYNGCYAYRGAHFPPETESLLRFDCDTAHLDKSIHGQTVIWAYKPNSASGRVILSGSHPEGVTGGERLQLMAALLRYCMDGNGSPHVKGKLFPGHARAMTRTASDSLPEYARIGDRQYHHFMISIPKGIASVTFSLQGVDGWTDFDMSLFASPHGFAFADNAPYQELAPGVSKTLTVKNPAPGAWYVSVFLETTVETLETHYGTQYTGRTDVLNGVPYCIKADLSPVSSSY